MTFILFYFFILFFVLFRIRGMLLNYIAMYKSYIANQNLKMEFKTISEKLVHSPTSAIQFNRVGQRTQNTTISGTETNVHKMTLLDLVFAVFYGEGTRNKLHKPIASNTLWGEFLADKSIDKTQFRKKCFSDLLASDANLIKDETFYFFLFMEYCPDGTAAMSLLKLISSYYNYLHQATSQAHNIEHTKIIVPETFKDACIFVRLGINLLRAYENIDAILQSDDTIKFLDFSKGLKNHIAFGKRVDFLVSHFLFFTVLTIIQDEGLFPALAPIDWTLPGDNKHIPPQEYNFLKFINYCLVDRLSDGRALFTNTIGKCFIKCICEKDFPPTYNDFRSKFQPFVKEFIKSLMNKKDFFRVFFGNVLAAVNVEFESSIEFLQEKTPTKNQKKRKIAKGVVEGEEESDEEEEEQKESTEEEKEKDGHAISKGNKKRKATDSDQPKKLFVNVVAFKATGSPSRNLRLGCKVCSADHEIIFHTGSSFSSSDRRFEYCLRHARKIWEDYQNNPDVNLNCADEVLKGTLSVKGHPFPFNFEVTSSSSIPKTLYREWVKSFPSLSCTCPLTDNTVDRVKRCLNSQCHNFSTNTECSTGCLCANRRIANARMDKELESKFQVLPVENIGYGLFTNGISFQAGDFIIEYVGKVYSSNMLEKKKNKIDHRYLMSIDSNFFIDSSESGNLSRFINHSCSPNCELQKWMVRLFVCVVGMKLILFLFFLIFYVFIR